MANRSPGKSPLPSLILAGTSVTQRTDTSVTVQNEGLTAQVSLLAPDLFRLRVGRGRRLSEIRSWAIPALPKIEIVDVRFGGGNRVVRIGTDRGEFALNLETGHWAVRDRYDLVVFEAPAGTTGFTGNESELTLALQRDEALFGLGETTGTYNKRGLVREFWNIDVGGHARTVHAGVRSLYLSIPFALSFRHGRAAGLFWDNPSRQTWDLGQTAFDSWRMTAASGEIDCYLFLGPACPEILERYTELTGRMPLPPAWALGYQQCRYSYESRERVEEVARTFRRRQIPCDVIYLDIHYMDGYRVFTFGNRFPRPKQMMGRLARRGFKVVTIVDPGVKDDPKFGVLQRGVEQRAFVKAADGKTDYRGEVWPGRVRFPDFLNPNTRRWWGEEQKRFQDLGVAGFWNDMNEPADFSQPKKDFPGTCRHQMDNGQQLRHSVVHNLYGAEMARASFEGALRHEPNRRPFIVTRAGYAGVQRYASVWTGDNDSSWEHLEESVQMLLNMSVSGVAFCGADVGGFHHNATGELLARWTQLGAFTPFFRNHSDLGTLPQEPWAFGERIEAICRRYISLRYQLLPYWKSLFLEAHRRGVPIIRPLFWHYPNDPTAVAASDQFLLGPDLLIAPVLRQGASARSTYLPVGIWFDFWTGEAIRGGQHVVSRAELEILPIYVRAGAIVPMIAVQQFVGEAKSDSVNLHVWPGSDGERTWYEDDGTSNEHQRGGFHERSLVHGSQGRRHWLRFGASQGTFTSEVKLWRVILRRAIRPVRVRASGKSVESGYDSEFGVCLFEVPNRPDAFEVDWR